MNRRCEKHGGDCDPFDACWLCDICAREGINLCSCGSTARYFSEALMQSVSCESEKCNEFVMIVSWDDNIREKWNNGERGVLHGDFD